MALVYLKNVVTLSLDTKRCTGCQTCRQVCPHQVFQLQNRRAYIAKKENCMECGACAKNCPVSAIEVRSGVG